VKSIKEKIEKRKTVPVAIPLLDLAENKALKGENI
jgi:hypothetical protein